MFSLLSILFGIWQCGWNKSRSMDYPTPPTLQHVIMYRQGTVNPIKKNINVDIVHLFWLYCVNFVHWTKCLSRKNKCYPWHLSRIKYLQVIWPQYFCYVGLHSKGDDFVTHSLPNKASVSLLVFQDVKNTSKSDGDTIMLIATEKSLTPEKFLTILVPATNSATTQNLCACQLRSTRM